MLAGEIVAIATSSHRNVRYGRQPKLAKGFLGSLTSISTAKRTRSNHAGPTTKRTASDASEGRHSRLIPPGQSGPVLRIGLRVRGLTMPVSGRK